MHPFRPLFVPADDVPGLERLTEAQRIWRRVDLAPEQLAELASARAVGPPIGLEPRPTPGKRSAGGVPSTQWGPGSSTPGPAC